MSYKVSMKNGINCTEAQWIKTNNLVDTSVKLAGEEAKDRLYEPKHKKKLVRVLTVIAYVFFVSLAAIMLSLYYVFLWNGGQKDLPKAAMQHEVETKCIHITASEPHIDKIGNKKKRKEIQQIDAVGESDLYSTSSIVEENTTSPDY